MAFNIFSPDYSFVTFNNEPDWNCVDDVSEPLPIETFADLNFQFWFDNSTFDNTVFYERYFFIPCDCNTLEFQPPVNGLTQPEFRFTGQQTTDPSGNYDAFTIITDFAGNDIDTYFNFGDCFRFCVVQVLYKISDNTIEEQNIIACSNLFVYTQSDCYTSLITYRNNEDSMSFNYETFNTFKNKVRLPLYLTRPQLPSDKEDYRKSDLTYQNLSEVVRKEFVLKTDYLSDYTHEKIKIALASDDLKIENENARVNDNFLSRNDYSIEWNEEVELKQAQASCTLVLSEALAYRNSNCLTVASNECENVEIVNQDNEVIFTASPGDTYPVLVISGIRDIGAPYTNQIINPFQP
jgi:hypothetical protein